MIEFFRRFHLFFTALIFLFLAFFILTRGSREGRDTSVLEQLLHRLSSPLQERIQGGLSWVREVGNQYIFLTGVQQENQELKRMLSSAREENNRLREAVLASERLEKLSALQSMRPSPTVVARIIARDPSSWFKTVLVNKGENDSVTKDMAVIAADGLVGRIMEASSNTAKVLLLTDPNSAVDIIVQRSRTQGIMEGKLEEVCILKYVPKNDDVQVGDKVITSGLGGIFPKGILIGTVTRVDRKRPGIFQYVEVTPTVDLSRLEEVLILEEES